MCSRKSTRRDVEESLYVRKLQRSCLFNRVFAIIRSLVDEGAKGLRQSVMQLLSQSMSRRLMPYI